MMSLFRLNQHGRWASELVTMFFYPGMMLHEAFETLPSCYLSIEATQFQAKHGETCMVHVLDLCCDDWETLSPSP